jgi:23S rRNA (adenine2503-C2)-methyltransferase
MLMENLKGLEIEVLENRLCRLGHSPFRARQLFRWVNQKKEHTFANMTDLSRAFRTDLERSFSLPRAVVVSTRESADGTIKYVIRFPDGALVETVFIPSENRRTLCISTQAGCKMACEFCATGFQKFSRNLAAWEIVDELLSVPVPAPVTNLVLMGMGEPFDNYEAVMTALRIFSHPMGPKIGKRHITVSTVGITSRIKEFLEADLAKLAISLHATTDEQRSKIIPVNRKHSLADLMTVLRSTRPKGRTRITFEYVLFEDFNDTLEDARRLARLVRDIPCKINLLSYNEISSSSLRRPSEERILGFQSILLQAGLTATYRRSRGRDIAAACGQLTTKTTASQIKSPAQG